MTVTLQEAQARLAELIEQLRAGEEIVITRDQQPVARLVGAGTPPPRPRQPGTLKGTVRYMAPDFDAPLEDCKDSMA
jgi:prevent-host-death family protein